MLQQTRHDLLQGPLPIAESEAAGRRRGVELLVSHVSQEAELVASSRQPVNQGWKIGVLRSVVAVVRALVVTTSGMPRRRVGAGTKKPWDPVTGRSRRRNLAGSPAPPDTHPPGANRVSAETSTEPRIPARSAYSDSLVAIRSGASSVSGRSRCAIGVVRSESTQITKALVREMRVFRATQGSRPHVRDARGGPRTGPSRRWCASNTSQQALLDYASSSHGEVVTAPHQDESRRARARRGCFARERQSSCDAT